MNYEMPTVDEALDTLNRLDQLQHEHDSLQKLVGRMLIRMRRMEEVVGQTWKDADGNVRRIVDLDTSHLRNILQGRFTEKVAVITAIRKELKRRETSEQWRKKLQQQDECRSRKGYWPQRAGYVFCGESFDVDPIEVKAIRPRLDDLVETPRGQARIKKVWWREKDQRTVVTLERLNRSLLPRNIVYDYDEVVEMVRRQRDEQIEARNHRAVNDPPTPPTFLKRGDRVRLVDGLTWTIVQLYWDRNSPRARMTRAGLKDRTMSLVYIERMKREEIAPCRS